MADSNGNQDPWGRRRDGAPPDLFDLLKRFFLGGAGGGAQQQGKQLGQLGKYWQVVVLALLALWALLGIFIVSPAEQAVVTYFGRYVETLDPGPHWIPRIIASKYLLNVQRVGNFRYQSEMLTQDENIVSVSLAVQYRLTNPRNFLFNVVDPLKTLQDATSSVLRQVVGQMTLDSILTTGRQNLRDEVDTQLNQVLERYQTGLSVTDVTLQPAKPPEAVTHAFDDAIKAREDEQRYINQAEAYARQVESIVKGQVARLQKSADAYEQSVVLQAEGAVARYQALLKPYLASPQVTRERLYLDAMSDVLSRTSNIILDAGSHQLLYLPLDQLIKQQQQQPSSPVADSSATDTAASAPTTEPISSLAALPPLLSPSGSGDADLPSSPPGSIDRPSYGGGWEPEEGGGARS